MHAEHRHSHHAETEIDPVCGMTVKVGNDTPKAEHEGHIYYFCAPRCREKFQAEPRRYVKAFEPPKQEPATPGVKA